MLQRLSKALAQVKAGNPSDNLLNLLNQTNHTFSALSKRNYQKYI